MSYFDTTLKLNNSDAFYNFETNQLIKRQTVSNPNFKPSPQYDFELKNYNNDFDREQYTRITPTTLTNLVYQSGAYLDFVLPCVNGVIDRFYLDLQITNQNTFNALNMPSIPLTFTIKTMVGSNEINTFDGDDQLVYCYRFINSNNKTPLLQLFGINMQVGGGAYITINANSTNNYLVPIRTLLSDVNFYLPPNNGQNSLGLKIRIQFRQGVSSNIANFDQNNGGVADNQIFINKCDLICHYLELTNVNLSPLQSLSWWDYKIPCFYEHMVYPISTTGLVQNNAYKIKLTSLQGLSCNYLIMFIRQDNPIPNQGQAIEGLVDSKIYNVDIQNINNKSLYSAYLFDYINTNSENYSRLFGKHDVLWQYVNDYAGLSRMIFIPLGVYSCGVKEYVNNGNVYGCPYTFDTDHYVNFNYGGNTIGSGNYNLHVLFAHISMLRVDATKGLNNIVMSLIRS